MRIESINRHQSSEYFLACKISPDITESVFVLFNSLRANTGKLKGIEIKEKHGLLYVPAKSLTPEIRNLINQLLTMAEEAQATVERNKAQAAALAEQKKQQTIDSAARSFGVPIE